MISSYLNPKNILGNVNYIDLYRNINIEPYKKSYNIIKKKYRFKKYINNKCVIVYLRTFDLKKIVKDNSINTNFTYKQYPYKIYFLRRFLWLIKKNITIKLTTNETIKKIITLLLIAIFSTIISYAIMKFILKWF